MTYEHVERLQKTVAVVVELLSHAQLFRDAMDYSPPSFLSVGFPRQGYWSEFCHFLLQGIFPRLLH